MNEEIEFKVLYDKPSKKGNPTDKSIVITIAVNKNKDVPTAGFAIKLPDIPHVPKIGRAVALKSKYSNIFDVDEDRPEYYLLNYLNLTNVRYPEHIMDRIKTIIGRAVVKTLIYNKTYKILDYTNKISD